jgi:DNA polymerase-3 subunit epsilon
VELNQQMDISRIKFNAIDFETATGKRNSACQVAIVTVEGGEIVNEFETLIKPPNNYYSKRNIDVHGITPDKTLNAPNFWQVYPKIKEIINGTSMVAHNESFDRSVLYACMELAKISKNSININDSNEGKWYCTQRAYKREGHKKVRLNDLCKHYGIELNHHEALSDARACAKLFIRYLKNF